MTLEEIVEKHGLPVTVNTKKEGYPPFTLIKQQEDGHFISKEYGLILNLPYLDDYYRVENENESV